MKLHRRTRWRILRAKCHEGTKPGPSIYYDADAIRALMGLPSFRSYRSNWRVLHVDGFETYPRLPASAGEPVKMRYILSYHATRPRAALTLPKGFVQGEV